MEADAVSDRAHVAVGRVPRPRIRPRIAHLPRHRELLATTQPRVAIWRSIATLPSDVLIADRSLYGVRERPSVVGVRRPLILAILLWRPHQPLPLELEYVLLRRGIEYFTYRCAGLRSRGVQLRVA